MVQERLALLNAEDGGQLDKLPCPQCGHACVSVWFTHPTACDYRTWFICEHCGFELRAQNAGQPKHYSLARDRTGTLARASSSVK
jgi:hypothetical protein